MVLARSTLQPGIEQEISEEEFERWLDQGIVYDGTPPVEPVDPFDYRVSQRLADADSLTRAAFDTIFDAVTDADTAALIPGPSATATALRAAFVAFAPAPNGVNDTTVLQGLIDAAETAGGGTIRLRAGIYRISALEQPYAVHVLGAGREVTTVQVLADTGLNTYAWTVEGEGSAIEQLTLQGPGTDTALGVAPCDMDGIRWGAKTVLREVRVRFFRSGISLWGDHQTAERTGAEKCLYGWHARELAPSGGDQTFIFCSGGGNKVASFASDGKGMGGIAWSTFIGGDFGASPYGIYGVPAASGKNNLIFRSTFLNTTFEHVGNSAIYDDESGGAGADILTNTFTNVSSSRDDLFYLASMPRLWNVSARFIAYNQFVLSAIGESAADAGTSGWFNATNAMESNVFTFPQNFLEDAIVATPSKRFINQAAAFPNEWMAGTRGGTFAKIFDAATAGHLVEFRDAGGVDDFNGVMATSTARGLMGVAMQTLSANQWQPVQTKGEASVLLAAAVGTRGLLLRQSSGTPTGVDPAGTGEVVGTAVTTGSASSVSSVYLSRGLGV